MALQKGIPRQVAVLYKSGPPQAGRFSSFSIAASRWAGRPWHAPERGCSFLWLKEREVVEHGHEPRAKGVPPVELGHGGGSDDSTVHDSNAENAYVGRLIPFCYS